MPSVATRPLDVAGVPVSLSSASAAVGVGGAPSSPKSLLVAYSLWLFGGWWGAHHLYLGRDEQAILCHTHTHTHRKNDARHINRAEIESAHCAWQLIQSLSSSAPSALPLSSCAALLCVCVCLHADVCTCGGFLLGWLRDVWRIPSYIGEANASEEIVETLRLQRRLSPRYPPFSLLAFVAQFLVAALFSSLASTGLDLLQVWPQPRFPTLSSSAGDWMKFLIAVQQWPHLLRIASVLLRILGASVGVWMTGNAHRVQTCSFRVVLLGTAAAQIAVSAQKLVDSNKGVTAAAAAAAAADAAADAAGGAGEVESDFSWFVLSAAIGTYLYFRTWSEAASTLTGTLPLQKQLSSASSQQSAAVAVAAAPLVYASPQPLRSRRSACFRTLRYILSCWLLFFLLTSYVLNCSIPSNSKSNDGMSSLRSSNPPLKIMFSRWHSSPQMAAIYTHLCFQWASMRQQGFQQWWGEFKDKYNIGALEDSYATLEFEPAEVASLTMAQIKKRRNQLALKFHPDKSHPDTAHMSAAEKESAFTKVQKAYEKIADAKEKEKEKEQAKGQEQKTEGKQQASGGSGNQRSRSAPPPSPTKPSATTGSSSSSSGSSTKTTPTTKASPSTSSRKTNRPTTTGSTASRSSSSASGGKR